MAENDTVQNKVAGATKIRITPEIERYLAIWERDPRSRVFAPLAEAYRKIGELDRAIEVCKRGLEIHPNYVSGRVALGRAYFDKGDLKEAKAQIEIVYEADPENLVAAKTLGEIFEAEGELEKALLCYRLAHYSTPSASELAEKIESVQNALRGAAAELAPKKVAPAQALPATDEPLGPPAAEEELSPLDAARKALRKSEAEAAGEPPEAEDDQESQSDLKQEIERLRRVPERYLTERDELEEATDEFFAKALLAPPKKDERELQARKGELASQSLTELMLRQGYTQRAVKVYEEFMASDSGNEQARQRIRELKLQLKNIDGEIKLRHGEATPKESRPGRDAIDPAVVDSLLDWLRKVRQEDSGQKVMNDE